jgi:hypothetical protein
LEASHDDALCQNARELILAIVLRVTKYGLQ